MKLAKPLLAVCGLGLFALQSGASEIWSSNFAVSGGLDGGSQLQTGNQLVYAADVQGWSSSGFHAAHAVEVTPSNWALMVYSGNDPSEANTYTLNTGFGANSADTSYWVEYQIAPTVSQTPSQASSSANVMLISVLNPLNQVVASTLVSPGTWDGTQTFHQGYFSYIGNGTGDVRLQITSGDAGTSEFDGAIYQIGFWDSQPSTAPEPASCLMMGLGLAGVALVGVRRLVC
jgi:hypothetical protein